MTERTWIPSDYHDEVIPPPRPSPSDWIVKLPDGRYALASANEDDEDEEVDPANILTEGETVAFAWTVRLGVFDIKFDCEGDWTANGEIPRQYPEGEVYFWFPGDPESVTTDLEDLLAQEFKNDPESYPAEEVTVACYAWNKRDKNFIFTAGQFIEAPQ